VVCWQEASRSATATGGDEAERAAVAAQRNLTFWLYKVLGPFQGFGTATPLRHDARCSLT